MQNIDQYLNIDNEPERHSNDRWAMEIFSEYVGEKSCLM